MDHTMGFTVAYNRSFLAGFSWLCKFYSLIRFYERFSETFWSHTLTLSYIFSLSPLKHIHSPSFSSPLSSLLPQTVSIEDSKEVLLCMLYHFILLFFAS